MKRLDVSGAFHHRLVCLNITLCFLSFFLFLSVSGDNIETERL